MNDSFQNRLIKLNDVEFNEEDAGQPYADAVNKSSISRFLSNVVDKKWKQEQVVMQILLVN
ncbi:MAG: hypothetical protein IPF58_09355 [Saprospirales bacterium]|nr:hypothetical protein [Saprospirales bacterium]